MSQKHRHRFGQVVEHDRHRTLFAETSFSGGSKTTPWIAGLAYQQDTDRNRAFATFDYDFVAPAIFGQVEHEVNEELTLAGSARADFHNEYGTQFSPRLSMLYRRGPWKVRVSLGRGFYAPTPFVEETEAAGFSRLEPITRVAALRRALPCSPQIFGIQPGLSPVKPSTASDWSTSRD
jgi:iron complex outermembrane receptor protein